MTIKELSEMEGFISLNISDENKEIDKVFCCDLLSVAMSKAPAGCCWVTVMGNINTLAVASLADCACVVLAEGTVLDESVVAKAQQQEINLLKTELPIFDAALKVHGAIKG